MRISTSGLVVNLFSGAGGWEQGAAALGLRHTISIEIDPVFATTARCGGHFSLVDDVSSIRPSTFAPTDGLLASPPCQGFSAAGRGAGRSDLPLILDAVRMMAAGVDGRGMLRDLCIDHRSELVVEPLRWALALRPQWLAWEQVPSVLPVWQACATALRSLGYSTWTGKLHAEAYGVPQTRTRAVLIASRVREVGEPRPTHSRYYPRDPSRIDPGMPPPVSMATALGWDRAEGVMRSNYGTGGDPKVRGERTIDRPAPNRDEQGRSQQVGAASQCPEQRNRAFGRPTGGDDHRRQGLPGTPVDVRPTRDDGAGRSADRSTRASVHDCRLPPGP